VLRVFGIDSIDFRITSKLGNGGLRMSVAGKRVFRNLVEVVVAGKGDIRPRTVDTVHSDASAILEALLAEVDEKAVLAALRHQGFDAEAYLPNLRPLAEEARSRRPVRIAGGIVTDA
jgi:hypothetical protein